MQYQILCGLLSDRVANTCSTQLLLSALAAKPFTLHEFVYHIKYQGRV